MLSLDKFSSILKKHEPLGKYTFTGIGGDCDFLAEPESVREFSELYKTCVEHKIPIRVLGNGCNLVVQSKRIPGVVVRMTKKAFCDFEIKGNLVNIGAGASIISAISFLSRNNLCGLETLIGIPGTVGGAVLSNTADKTGPITRFVQKIHVLDAQGNPQVREKDEISFHEKGRIDDPIIHSVEFSFEKDNKESIVKRLRKAWISRKIHLPLGIPYAGKVFRNPRGLSAASLIEQAGLLKSRIGGAEVCDRDPNYMVLHPGASSDDVLKLIENIRQTILEKFNVQLEVEMAIW